MTTSDDQREAATWPDNDPTFTPEPILWHVQLQDETRDCDGTYPLTPRYVMARCEDDAGNRAGEDFDMSEGCHYTGQYDTRPATPAEIEAFIAALSSRPVLPSGDEELADFIHASHRQWCLLDKRCPESEQIAAALASRPSSPQATDETTVRYVTDCVDSDTAARLRSEGFDEAMSQVHADYPSAADEWLAKREQAVRDEVVEALANWGADDEGNMPDGLREVLAQFADNRDPREYQHIECDCVPNLGPSHCHLCSGNGSPVEWPCAASQAADERGKLIAEAKREALQEASREFMEASIAGVEPVLNRLAGDLLQKRADRLYPAPPPLAALESDGQGQQ